MAEGSPYQRDSDDILVHRFDGQHEDTYFAVRTGYGVGTPHFFVCLDENGGERSWWLDPEQAETLGKKLVEYAAECQQLNAHEDRRLAEWKEQHRDPKQS